MKSKSVYFALIAVISIIVIVLVGYLLVGLKAKKSEVSTTFNVNSPINYEKYKSSGLNQEKLDLLFNKMRDLDKTIQTEPNYDDMLTYAGFLKIIGENEESLLAFERARDKFTKLGPAYAEIANLYIYPFARYDEAVVMLKTAIEKAPYKSDYYRTLADLYVSKFPDKINEIEPLMIAGATETPENATNFYSYLITFFERQGDYKKAIFYAKKCIELNPENELYKTTLKELQNPLKQ